MKFSTTFLLANKIKKWVYDSFNSQNISKEFNFKKRCYSLGLFFAAVLVLILIRYAWLSFLPTQLRAKLVNTGNRQFESFITLQQPRATITDRNGSPLAVSIPSTSLFILPRRMPKDKPTLSAFGKQFSLSTRTVYELAHEKHNFIWLRRQMSSTDIKNLGSLKKWRSFVGSVDEPKRVYPEKELAAQLIGFVGQDGNGLEGIEKIYNDRLNSKPIRSQVMRDARGNLVMVSPSDASKPSQEVSSLTLSIDLTIQQFAQTALKAGVIKTRSKGGSAIVMDVKSGEILAIASYPSYNLNSPTNDLEARRFRPIMDAIELGSVVKPMWVAKALDLGVIKQDTKFFAEYGKMNIPGGTIHDTHKLGMLTPEEIIKFSSNIGAYKVVQKIGRQEFYKALMHIGFGRQPGTGLPGEWGGHIQKPELWREMRFANMAFGQGFAISALQLIHGLSIIVGGGADLGVNLLKVDVQRKNKEQGPPLRYISPETSKVISKMMESVVEEEGGTGSTARIPGVLVAGKTGTAQVWSHEKHSYSDRTPVFEGTLPADDPKLAIVIVLDRAGVRPAFGGPLAGPIFAEIGKKTVDYLNSKGIYSIKIYDNKYDHKNKLTK